MSYAIVGFGKIGQALAHAFARKNINVTVASRRPPEALAPQARAIGPRVVAKSLQNAVEAARSSWQSRSGSTARLRRPCRAGKAQPGRRAGARTRPHLGSAHLPGFVQEGAVIDDLC